MALIINLTTTVQHEQNINRLILSEVVEYIRLLNLLPQKIRPYVEFLLVVDCNTKENVLLKCQKLVT